jgi:hypothetical protein
MKKFNMAELKPVSTPMSTATSLDPNEDGEAVDQIKARVFLVSRYTSVVDFRSHTEGVR